jgi:hypothetical protein
MKMGLSYRGRMWQWCGTSMRNVCYPTTLVAAKYNLI